MEEATDRGCREEEKEEEKDDGGLWRMMTLQDQTPLSSPPLLSRRLSFFLSRIEISPLPSKKVFFLFRSLLGAVRNEKRETNDRTGLDPAKLGRGGQFSGGAGRLGMWGSVTEKG